MDEQPEKGEEPGGAREEDGGQTRVISEQKLKEIFEDHKRWLASDGKEGKRANLKEANLKKANLKKANLKEAILKKANLKKANLKEANLKKANLKKANIQRANLQRANLQRANLQGADLNHASLVGADLQRSLLYHVDFRDADLCGAFLRHSAGLQTAELLNCDLSNVSGLLGNEFAGQDITGATLPEDIARFDALGHVAEISKHARTIFLGVIGGCVYSWLTIATTTDAALVVNAASTPLPIIQTKVPIAGFYWAAPAILLGLYIYLHMYLQRLWESLADLPAVFPDGKPLDKKAYPWLLSGLVRTHVPLLKDDRSVFSKLEVAFSIAAAWMLVPFTLFLFWGRYLPRHDMSWTLVQVGLLGLSMWCGTIFYRRARSTLQGHKPSKFAWREILTSSGSCATGVLFLSLSAMAYAICDGAINGHPPEDEAGMSRPKTRTLKEEGLRSDVRALVPLAAAFFGFRTHADLTEADVSIKPSNWTGIAERPRAELDKEPGLLEKAKAELVQVKPADLREVNLRHALAIGAFLAKSDLRGANLQGADFRDADLQEANLRRAKLQKANLDGADLRNAVLEATNLQGANLSHANLQEATLYGADLREVDLRGTNLRKANFGHARLEDATNLTQAQLDTACGDELTKLPPGLTIKPCPETE